MRILLKCPTRSRPQRVMETIRKYMQLANHPEQLGVAISCDSDDGSMLRNLVQEELHSILRRTAWHHIFFSDNKTKIQACNANMNQIDYQWDIVVLVSDDMIPTVQGYDDVIRNHMLASFPDTNGILWFHDGHQAEKLNTLCIYGRKFYEEYGCIYQPEYKSLFCDTELTDLCRTTYKDRCLYVPYCIIRHEHPGTGYGDKMDALYQSNQKYWNDDMYTYIRRKSYPYHWSVLIATIPGREQSLQKLINSVREKCARIAPDLKFEFCLAYDNREMSIGKKRQYLLEQAKGKYLSFMDDDDEITDAYIEDLQMTIQGNYSCMRLRGQIQKYTFTHSLENKLSDKMARDEVFLRPPNHLNPVLSDVAKLVPFKDAINAEDLDWTIRMAKSGFLTTEYQSDANRIHYIYNMGDRVIDSGTLENQKKMSFETMLQLAWKPGNTTPSLSESRPKGLRLGPRGFVSA